MNRAFVLGNGTSRLAIDADSLKKYGKVYGCNAIYRDCVPDYLIAVDKRMVDEIIETNTHKKTNFWTNPKKDIKEQENINFFVPAKGWSSGPTALYLASTHKYDEIYVLGFDYLGTNGKFNNVYADTKNYKKSTDNATYHGNWIKQTEIILQEFKDQRYIKIGNDDSKLELFKYKNIEFLTYSTFKERINYQN